MCRHVLRVGQRKARRQPPPYPVVWKASAIWLRNGPSRSATTGQRVVGDFNLPFNVVGLAAALSGGRRRVPRADRQYRGGSRCILAKHPPTEREVEVTNHSLA